MPPGFSLTLSWHVIRKCRNDPDWDLTVIYRYSDDDSMNDCFDFWLGEDTQTGPGWRVYKANAKELE